MMYVIPIAILCYEGCEHAAFKLFKGWSPHTLVVNGLL